VNGAPALGLKVTADIKSANPAQAADSGLAHAYALVACRWSRHRGGGAFALKMSGFTARRS